MINELNEPNLPRTSLTQNRGKWSTKLVTIAKKLKTVQSDDESKPLLNGTVTLKADDSLSYIIAINNEVVQLSDRNTGLCYFIFCKYTLYEKIPYLEACQFAWKNYSGLA